MDQNQNQNTNTNLRIDALEKQMADLRQSSTIPIEIYKAFKARGFVVNDFFVFGMGTISGFGEFRIGITGSTDNSIALITGHTDSSGGLTAELSTGYNDLNFGSSSSQFDITNPAGDTFRYTWDGTGSNPNIDSVTLPIGSRVQIFSPNFNPANQNAASRPFFFVSGSGNNYFEIFNATPGVAENNVTLGSGGSITGGAPNDSRELYVLGTSGDEFSYVVFLNKLPLFSRL